MEVPGSEHHAWFCGRAASMLATKRKAAGFPTGNTFDVWDPNASSIPAPTQQALRPWNGSAAGKTLCSHRLPIEFIGVLAFTCMVVVLKPQPRGRRKL